MKNPKYAVIAVTYRCNGRCVMCNIWKATDHVEADAEIYGRLPQSLKTINVTGGEPFLRLDLPKIISIISRRCKNPRIVISTNGLLPRLIEEKLGEIARIHPRIGVRISVDGIGEIHDVIRGVSGSFDRAMESVDICKKIGVSDLGLGFTVLENNVGQLKSIFDLTKKLGIQLAVSIAQNSEVYFRVDNLAPISQRQILKDGLEAIVSDQLKRFNIKEWFRAYFLSGLYQFSAGKSPLLKCTAASDFFFMDPKGDVYICPILDRKLGNLAQTSFEEIWGSGPAIAARGFAAACSRRCWMACTAAPFIKCNMSEALAFIMKNKLRAHLGKEIIIE